jgi:hypothetical protein
MQAEAGVETRQSVGRCKSLVFGAKSERRPYLLAPEPPTNLTIRGCCARFLIGKLVETALWGCGSPIRARSSGDVGPLSLPLAKRFASVAAVESGARASGDLRFNTPRADLTLVEKRETEVWLDQLESAPDLVFFDGTRAGSVSMRSNGWHLQPGAPGCRFLRSSHAGAGSARAYRRGLPNRELARPWPLHL